MKRVLYIVVGLAALGLGIWQLYGVFAGKKTVFSPSKAQAIIRAQATSIAAVKAVTCPDRGAMKQGDTVKCDLTFADGTAAGVILTALSDKYDFQLAFAEPLSSAEFFEKMITDGIKEQTKTDVQVDCGTGIVKGPTVTCTATDATGTKATIVGEINTSGGGTWKVKDAPTPP